jgi:hypothetical protein
MITVKAVEEMLNGLKIAQKIIDKELDELRSEKEKWHPGSQTRNDLTCEIMGIHRVSKSIEKQIRILQEKK